MSDNLKDILSHLNPDVDQETLMRYLQDKLTPAEQHEIEKGMMENDFDSDALDGLQGLKGKKHIAILLDQLNTDLKLRTARKKKWREKLQIKSEPWLIAALVIILLLVVISYMLVHQKLHD